MWATDQSCGMFGAPKLMPQKAGELISFDTTFSLAFGVSHRGPGNPSRLPDQRRMEVDELPAPIAPNKHSGPVPLVIHLSVLVLSFGGGATRHHGRIAVDPHLDLVGHKRFEMHAPGLAVVQILRPILDNAVRAVMSVVLVQDPIKEDNISPDDRLAEVLDELHEFAFVFGSIAE